MDNFFNEIGNKIKNEVLDDVLVNFSSDTEKEIEKNKIINSMENNIFITDTSSIGDIVKASEINRISIELFIDIFSSYEILKYTLKSFNDFDANMMDNIEIIKSKIKDINNNIATCRKSLNNIYMPYYHLEDFSDVNRFTRERKYQLDRYGGYYNSNSYCNIEGLGCAILPLLRRDNSLRYDDVVETGNISINFQLGKGFIGSATENEMSNIIDKFPDTFWKQTILSDAPFNVSFKKEKPDLLFLNDGYFYNVDTGSLFEMCISFESVNVINEISINPYCKFPIDIVAIRYKITDDYDEELKEIVFPDNNDMTLRSATIDGKITFRFQDTLLKNIYLVFNQRHYSKDIYLYNAFNVLNNEKFNNGSKYDKEMLFKANYDDRNNNNAYKNNINDLVVNSANLNVRDILYSKEKDTRKILKYEYEYGFKDIGCYNNHYDRIGFLVTKPLKIDNNTKSIKIITDEIHQKDSYGNTITDIEYYITSNLNPTLDEWIPILPENKKEIYSEELIITSETRAYFRFQTEKIISVMKNGEPIEDQIAEYFIDTDERTGKYFCIQIFNYDFDAIYSISYVPEDGHTEIDFSKNLISTIEEFKGDDSSAVTLSNYVFGDNAAAYTAKIIDNSVNNFGNEIIAKNVIDLEMPSMSFKNFTNDSNELQFYIDKNILYFNKEISNTSIIEVSYSHLISDIILKAVMKRNSTKDGWLTPILNSVEFNIETI